MKKLVLFLIFVSITLFGLSQTNTTVEEIINNPGRFNHERVVIEGFVARYVVGSATTSSYYELQGDYGGRIRINTAEPSPTINARYRVTGSVTIHMQEALIIEISKVKLEEPYLPPPPPKKTFSEVLSGNILLVIIAASLVIIVILIFYNLKPGRASSASLPIEKKSGDKKSSEEDKRDHKEPETVRFKAGRPKTVRAIPGKLEILVGPDQGKSLSLVGSPTSDGAVATIGRFYEGWENDLSGDKKYAHMCIKDESRTLSRMQAEIISKNKQVFLKNLGSVNPTKVDGRELQVNEAVMLENGSVIAAGHMEFRYKASNA